MPIKVLSLRLVKISREPDLSSSYSVPQTPHFVRGVINLRGKVIPVIDLRLKFGMEEKETTEERD